MYASLEMARKSGVLLASAALLLTLARGGFEGVASAAPFTWPHVPDQIARGLSSTDVAERRASARKLVDLPRDIADPLVRRALGDPDVEVRLLAATAAVAAELPRAGDLVVAWVAENDVRLRLAACQVVRASPTKTSVTALSRALSDASADVRGAAAAALGGSGLAEAVSPLLGHVDDASPEVRGEVVRALGRLRDPRAVLPLVGRLQDAAPDVRRAAARSLGALGDPRAASAIVVALADAVPQVRLDAVEALGALRSPDGVLALSPLALGASSTSAVATPNPPRAESSETLRAAALRALARIGDARAIAAIVAALPLDDADADDLTREAAADVASSNSMRSASLGPRGLVIAGAAPRRPSIGSSTPAGDALVVVGKPALPALAEAVRGNAGPRATSSAARALAIVDGKAAVPAIERALLAGALPVRAAIAALSRADVPEAVPPVLERLDDPEPLVRRAALDAALSLVAATEPDGRLVDPAAAALRDARRPLSERILLVRLLGRSGSPRAQAPLVALLAKPTEKAPPKGVARSAIDEASRRLPMRIAAIEALGALGLSSPSVDRVLLAALSEDEPQVRRAASTSLARVGSTASLREVVRRLVDAAEQDRAALGVALSGITGRSRDESAGELIAESLGRASSDVRDALIESLGRAPGASAMQTLVTVSASPDADDRRKVAEALSGATPTATSLGLLRKLSTDSDGGVRAAAVWSLGRVGDASDASRLGASVADADAAASGNAAAALARVAARASKPELASATLCKAISDRRAYVAVNALAGLRLFGARCPMQGVANLLQTRKPVQVRQAAATYLRDVGLAATPPAPEAVAALARCTQEERDVDVAEICASKGPGPMGDGAAVTRDLTVFVVPDGGTEPRPRSLFAVVRPDGFVHLGVADRRGSVLERDLGVGDVRLDVPAALVR